MIINQWVPAAHAGDAIGDSARRVRGLLRRMGHESELYALTVDDDVRDDVRRFSDPGAQAGHITIFHFAVPSPMTSAFARLRGGRVLQYHNVTPAHFFAPYSPALFRLASLARTELASLAGLRGLWTQAATLYREAIAAHPAEPAAYLQLAQTCNDARRPDVATEALRRYLSRDPLNSRIWIELAAMQLSVNQANDALASLTRAVEVGGEAARAVLRVDRRFARLLGNRRFVSLAQPVASPVMDLNLGLPGR